MIKKVFFTWNGLGDQLCLIGAAYNWYLKHGEKLNIGVNSNFFEKYFDHCNYMPWCHFHSFGYKTIKQTLKKCHDLKLEPTLLSPQQYIDTSFWYALFHRRHKLIRFENKHIMHSLCERMGFNGEVEISFNMDYSSFKSPVNVEEYICIMTGGVMNYKAVPSHIMQSIVNNFGTVFKFVQIGSSTDVPLLNVIDMRGTNLEVSCGIIRGSRFIITATGGLTHLAAALV